jgi:hypothetical protein
MLSKKAKVSHWTFGDKDDDTSVATTVNTNEDEEFTAEEDQLRRTRYQTLGRNGFIMMLLYVVALYGLMFLDAQVLLLNQTWQTILSGLFWIVYLFPIFIIIWACSCCYRENPEETINCILRCGKGIGFVVCCIPVVVLAVLPWILFLNFATFDWWKVILVSFAQLVFGWLGKIYFNKHWDEELISANTFAVGWKCALLHIFVQFFLTINAAFTFFGWFNMLAELLLDPSGDAIWPIFLSMFLGVLICSASMLVSGILAAWTLILVDWAVHKFEGRCCRNGDTAYSRAASQQTNNGITMVEIV